ncbi:MAG: TetR/AcrR family transcriptional regulator [Acidimicrobiaceae bacterium]|nr:TetR/AcrR family transcriptional regulator [Acidimicrobiaceae bacterium]
MASAIDAFGGKGFLSASVSEIAREAGTDTDTVYARWSDKRELFDAAFREITERRMLLLIKSAPVPATSKLAMLGDSLLTTRRDSTRNMWIEACALATRDPDWRPALPESLDVEAREISEIVEEAKKAGAIYSRWLTKRELFLAAVEHRGLTRTQVVSGQAELSAADKLATLGAGLLGPDEAEARNLMLEACVMARRDSSLSADVAQSLDVEAAVLAEVVEQGKAAGEIGEALSTVAIVLACQALGLGARLAAAAGPRDIGLPSADDWQELMTRFAESIGPSQS